MSDAAPQPPQPQPQPPPSPAPIMDLLNGFRRSKVLFALVQLGVPDLIARAGGGPAPLPQLAHALRGERSAGAAEPSLDGLGRLLDAAVGLGLLAGGRSDGYALTDLARAYLLSDAELSLSGYVVHSNQVLFKLFGELETAVLTGSNVWDAAFGLCGDAPFKSLYADEASMLRFMRGMHSFSKLSARPVLSAFDLSRFEVLLDLGGATGALAAEACAMHPRLQARVVDLPHVVELARAHFGPTPSVQAVAPRLSWVAGDFFAAPQQLPDGDLVVLSRILHDWGEPRCLELLRSVHAKLPPGGAVLLCEMLLDESGVSPPEVLLQSLNMLTQTQGRERSLSEYSGLLEAAGFERVEGKRTGSYLDAVIAWKSPGAAGAARADE